MMSDRDRSGQGSQLPLEFSHDVALSNEDFFISSSNENAYDLINAWPHWPKRSLMLIGPPGSGKTHLATIWSHRAAAAIVTATDVTSEAIPDIAEHAALVIEDLPGAALDERALFHLLNMITEHRRDLLMTTGRYPADWGVALPDLASRVRAVPVVELGQPDEALLRAILVKLFADRQLVVEETVISFLLPRMERSTAAARRLVEIVDRKALAEGSRVTRPFVAKALKELTADHSDYRR